MKVTKCDICGKEYDPDDPGLDEKIVPFEWREVKPGQLELTEMDVCFNCASKIDNYISTLKEADGGSKGKRRSNRKNS